ALDDPIGTALDSSVGGLLLQDTIRQGEDAVDASVEFIDNANQLEATIRAGGNVLEKVGTTAKSGGRAVLDAFLLGLSLGSVGGKSTSTSSTKKAVASTAEDTAGLAGDAAHPAKGRGPQRTFTGTSRGDVVETARVDVGLSRELRVAESVGGRV